MSGLQSLAFGPNWALLGPGLGGTFGVSPLDTHLLREALQPFQRTDTEIAMMQQEAQRYLYADFGRRPLPPVKIYSQLPRRASTYSRPRPGLEALFTG